MALALFDLDDTLIVGNCETDWFEYLITQGHYNSETYTAEMARFEQEYESGCEDIDDYMHFVLRPLAQQTMDTLWQWRDDWFTQQGKSLIAKHARATLNKHREENDTLVIISASSAFCVEPFAHEFNVDHFLCSQPEISDNRYTGRFHPPTCFAAEKITHLNRLLDEEGYNLDGSYFYSDSRNDIPLLELADNPIAVNADAHLANFAAERNWPQLDLR